MGKNPVQKMAPGERVIRDISKMFAANQHVS